MAHTHTHTHTGLWNTLNFIAPSLPYPQVTKKASWAHTSCQGRLRKPARLQSSWTRAVPNQAGQRNESA
eukprot:2767883-Amphidinium_carterae.4